MLVLKRSKLFLTVAEIYFFGGEGDRLPEADLILHTQSTVPLGRATDKLTLQLDLAQEEEELSEGCSVSNRYKIRRGLDRDDLKLVINGDPSEADVVYFCTYHTE